MKIHSLSAEPTHSVWDRKLEPRLEISSGDQVEIACLDASGGQVHPAMSSEEFRQIDTTRIHALTGPIRIADAEPGDVLEIHVLATQHHGWGWTSLIPGLGFLKERFLAPYLFHWTLDGDRTTSLAPATLPLRPFLGVMGVAREETGSFRTRAPGSFGGNLDVRELCAGAKLYLPVFTPGALFSCGDGHAAQGDGEVCINGIECPLDVTLGFRLHKHQPLAGPVVEARATIIPDSQEDAWIVVESATDIASAGRAATHRMIDLMMSRWGLSDIHAYILCSVAMRLRLSQVVNEPMYTVSAGIGKDLLPKLNNFISTHEINRK